MVVRSPWAGRFGAINVDARITASHGAKRDAGGMSSDLLKADEVENVQAKLLSSESQAVNLSTSI
jgi:hypothetical protein